MTYDRSAKKYDEWIAEPEKVCRARSAVVSAVEMAKTKYKIRNNMVNYEVHDGVVLFIPEKVVRSRTIKGKVQVVVKWLGESENTWEPIEKIDRKHIDVQHHSIIVRGQDILCTNDQWNVLPLDRVTQCLVQ